MKKLLFFFFLSVFVVKIHGQKNWSLLNNFPSDLREERAVKYLPSSFQNAYLNFNAFKDELANTPGEFDNSRNLKLIDIPMPNGEIVEFKVTLTETMHPELAAKYPSIKSYKITSADHSHYGRFDISPFGFRAVIETPEGEVYIDPLYRLNQNYHIIYYTKNHTEPTESLKRCGTHDDHRHHHDFNKIKSKERNTKVNIHKYDLALTCTGEWGARRGTVEIALADMNSSVNRLNQIFENQFASRFVLIKDNDKLIHLDGATDPYTTPNSGHQLLGQNTNEINNILGGNTGYDMGHIYTNSCSDVGGVALLGAICSPQIKGAGVTCMYDELIYITVQVAAHEMGHQFSATHTFNNCTSESQNAGGNGFEPGGGSTIMAYGGLCGSNNFVGRNDAYYHNGSLVQIYDRLRDVQGGAYDCAEKIETENIAPVATITSPKGVTIPISTAFILDGKAFDANEDKLTYNWEQKDGSDKLCPLGDPSGDCPLFRSFNYKNVPYRVFPFENNYLNGIPNVAEILPDYSRKMNFSFTVKDNNPNGSICDWENITISSTASAGPFNVTFPSDAGITIEAGEEIDIKWDVAKTDVAPVNAKYVDIYLSKRNALHPSDTSLYLIAEKVPNNGSFKTQMLSRQGADNRIVVRGSDHIFFDASNQRFVIKKASSPRVLVTPNKYFAKICSPNETSVEIKTRALEGYNGKVSFELIDNIPGFEALFNSNEIEAGTSNTLNVKIDKSVKSGKYNLSYKISTDSNSYVKNLELDITSANFEDLAALIPVNGEKDAELPTFSWKKSANATSYQLEVSKSPTFSDLIINKTVTDTFFKPQKTFDKKSIYFWRIKAINSCRSGEYTSTRSFGTLTEDCRKYVANGLPLNIPTTISSIESKINVPTGKNISDINVTKLKMNHQNFKDLTGTLISPAGTRVILFSDICPKFMTIDALLDEQAPNPFGCITPATGQYRPQEKFSSFNGEDATGVWTLELKDNKTSNGGKLEGFELEICASIAIENPYLVNNLALEVIPGESKVISNAFLKVEDKSNGPSELTYTVVQVPTQGVIQLNGVTLNVGSTFTQADIDQNKLIYKNTGDGSVKSDAFSYLVKDIEGGWLGVNEYLISILTQTATKDLDAGNVKIYPNPAYSSIFIEVTDDNVFTEAIVHNSLGKEMMKTALYSSIK